MKLFKYTEFLKESLEDIDSICKKYGIENYTIKDGLVNVDGGVILYDCPIQQVARYGGRNLRKRKLTKLPLKFGEVSGNFDCSYNQLTSLEGAPEVVEKNFYCSLINSPSITLGSFFSDFENKYNKYKTEYNK